ncbi:AAA family ATPase [Bradyrhizobium sp. 157]|uniref:ATP-binding protein n=1 Tax=Bradyrhizobium sp. 157 TaxID=2782631 RepID=UPI001FF8A8C9|nr:AAA family ATPase [Bradyrhizobium sp. 157]MCK1638167.1 AAA family ATPase [Bradyrhizobium sp. 157]
MSQSGSASGAKLHIDLLGGCSFQLGGHGKRSLPTKKSQALLAYLAVPVGRFHAREKLTAMFWGDTSETLARQSFRQALVSVRRLAEGERPLLLTRSGAIALDAEAVVVDVALLETALADGTTEGLAKVAELCKGEFLAGLDLNEPDFNEWRSFERDRLNVLAVEALAKLVDRQASKTPEAAIQTARRLLAIDPSQERMQRTLMRLLLGQGQRAAALKQYQQCVDWFERELGVEPEEETQQVYRDILRSAGPGPDRQRRPASLLPRVVNARADEVQLVGREFELGHLNDALTNMLDTGGRVVLLRGEAGIGKSRLLREFIGNVPSGVRVLIGRCHETEQILPLHAWIDALRESGTVLDAAVRDRLGAAANAQLVRVFPELRQSGSQPVTAPEQYSLLFDALAQLLVELASGQPTVFILEDLHWCDGLSARFLAFFGRRIDRLPILVVGSMRPEELVDVPVLAQSLKELRSDTRLDEIPLGALSQRDAATLIQALLPAGRRGPQSANAAQDIWVASEGNPFIIVESVRSLDHERPAIRQGESSLIREFVTARLERLPELPRRLVPVAAAIGRDFTFSLLARAGKIAEVDAAIAVEQLVRRHILTTEGERVDFCHDWIRRVAYEQLMPQQRRLLHSAVGEAIEELHRGDSEEIADQLGHHYLQAGDARRAIPSLIQFAALAGRRYALDDALRAFQQAADVAELLPASERDHQKLDLALRQTFVLSMLGRQREIWEILRTHADHVGRVVDPLLISEYHFRVGLTCFYLGRYAEGKAAGERALSEGERAGNGDAIGKALHALSLIAYETGHPQQGIAHARRAISLLETTREPQWLGLVYHDLALNSVVAGDLQAALDAARQEQVIGRAIGWPRIVALAGSVIAWALALRGDHEDAIEAAQQSLELSRDPMVSNLVLGSMGLAYVDQGDANTAVTILSEVVVQLRKSPVRSGEMRCLAFLSEAQLLAGDLDRAGETASRALELEQSDGLTFSSGLVLRALGRIDIARNDFDEAEARLLRALSAFEQCGAAFEVARTLADLAALFAHKSERKAARGYLAAALIGFRRAGAPRRIAEARRVHSAQFGRR